MVAPIVEEGTDTRWVYFPGKKVKWYYFKVNITDGSMLSPSSEGVQACYLGQIMITIKNSLPSSAPMFLKGGSLVFLNTPTTRSSKLDNSFHVCGMLDDNNSSVGSILAIKDYNR